MKKICIPKYSIIEERINFISHGIGAILSVIALIIMLFFSKNVLEIICSSIFGGTLILLYTVSTLYHAFSPRQKAKAYLRVVDHCMVFLLVLGTYTPLALLAIGGKLGYIILFFVFCIVSIGMICNIKNLEKYQLVSVLCHLTVGWSSLLLMRKLLPHMHQIGIAYLILGGCMYTIGAVLYRIGRYKKYMHSIFHFFCLAGSIVHFLMIVKFVL